MPASTSINLTDAALIAATFATFAAYAGKFAELREHAEVLARPGRKAALGSLRTAVDFVARCGHEEALHAPGSDPESPGAAANAATVVEARFRQLIGGTGMAPAVASVVETQLRRTLAGLSPSGDRTMPSTEAGEIIARIEAISPSDAAPWAGASDSM